ncbi:cyanidin 3-O-galactoside 2''-O-xylosyltransferase FGGT1 [Cucumis sativus]|uniref:Glycosyltransferase n=1 Tax=Cucumis sativus TaxID=3659 RepID=A0A0A0K5E3_CUCSA|nr:cyanidin 3-O-galactoside 2''-O-xylosyltransferase FGGT1 [Cucumis sativus]XP_011658689.1 cyanidin 3-O-galactoside 2''-O-xylosyltransferase FGGT1 [Cucumis sativus]KGN43487.1 hypothetical protein Csa_020299 [Cucumis sativus]
MTSKEEKKETTMVEESLSSLHIAMYPWFAFGHMIPFLQIANKLANKGHRISIFIPSKTLPELQHFNHFPNLITFVLITVPHVDGLPPGAQTTADISHPSQLPLLMISMDLTEPEIASCLQDIKPNVIFYDFAYWVTKLADQMGITSIYYNVVSAVTVGYVQGKIWELSGHDTLTQDDFMQPPPGFPSSSIKLHAHEAQNFASLSHLRFSNGIALFDQFSTSFTNCNALALKSCREIEGPFIGYIENELKKHVLLSGAVDLEPLTTSLEERWEKWLAKFHSGSVIYCAFGSECILTKIQFQELLLGLELSNLPFLAVLKPPEGIDTVEAALPEGFEQRIEGRGVVYGGWVQQQQILEHPSIGCFVTHCGAGSLNEALVRKCQLVLLPHVSDHFFRARTLSSHLKVGVEVEKREEDGFFSKESVCKAVKTVMDEENESGKEVRANIAKLRELLVDKDLEESYINNFIHKLRSLIV